MRTQTLLLAAATLGLSGFLGAANATPLNESYTISAWTGPCNPAAPPNCAITDTTQQALPTNPLTGATEVITAQTASGPLNLSTPATPASSNTYGTFFTPLTFTVPLTGPQSATILSTGTYPSGGNQTTTLMKFVFTLPAGSNTLTISHDDGISLFNEAAPGTNLDPGKSAPQDVGSPDVISGLGAGTYDLWYIEANGAPATLDVEFANTPPPPSVPEPSSLALFGAGLIGLGLLRRRRRAA